MKDSNNMRDVSREKLLEILHFHNKRENLLSSQPNVLFRFSLSLDDENRICYNKIRR